MIILGIYALLIQAIISILPESQNAREKCVCVARKAEKERIENFNLSEMYKPNINLTSISFLKTLTSIALGNYHQDIAQLNF